MPFFDNAPTISLLHFSAENFEQIVVELSKSQDKNEICQKLQVQYLIRYLSDIGAETIVVEKNYIDRDYLEDYSEYYVKCFRPYERFCSRLHFFASSFIYEDFLTSLVDSSYKNFEETLQRTYLGFVVIKPLPNTFIGRTCLKTYPSVDRRFYPVTRQYPVNLASLTLSADSLAYQEQDSVVAACATSALWSVLQATGKLFQHPILSPVQITQAATDQPVRMGRAFPNRGLFPLEICKAIEKIGLEPEVRGVASSETLKGITYAYLKAGLPFILGGQFIEHSTRPENVILGGQHAVAVTGYSLDGPLCANETTGTLFRSSRITKLYAHDDQIGPFARMPIKGAFNSQRDGKPVSYSLVLETTYPDSEGNLGNQYLIPEILILPLYHKIRIAFDEILIDVIGIDNACEVIRARNPEALSSRIEWDVYLALSSDIKSQWKKQDLLKPERLRAAMLMPLPRFVWRAVGCIQERPIIEILYDATDVRRENGNTLAIICHDEGFQQALS